uniref:Rhizobium-directed polar growth protein n=1 Tax=Parasponia rugosa TaxID=1603294 RepID=A0A221I0W7_9ROSA|nr:rhizobium-directed polar growth protein [Parasponia rugosa]
MFKFSRQIKGLSDFLKLKSEKPQDRMEFKFKFSNLQAFQVPKGWDKLFISLVSVKTGKSVAKSGKATVCSGSCWWEETLTVWIPQDNNFAEKDTEECLLKLVVATGSVRFGTLGEAVVNLASYITQKTCPPISLPLKKCDHGTILKVKIQCLTPRTNPRDAEGGDTSPELEEMKVEYDGIDNNNKLDMSNSILARTVRSSSTNQWDNTHHPGEQCGKAGFLPSSSRHGFGSNEKSSPRKNLFSNVSDLMRRQDSAGSQTSSHGSYHVTDSTRSVQSSSSKVSSSGSHSQHQREESERASSATATLPLQNAAPSKDVLDAAEAAIELLKAEARMWEQNARKLLVDVANLQKEFSNQEKHKAGLEEELSVVQTECDEMRQKVEELKMLLKETREKHTAYEELVSESRDRVQKEFKEEIKIQKESNANLSFQLKKSVEANAELVSVLRELESTVEEQMTEMNKLSIAKSEFEELQQKRFQESEENFERTICVLEKSLSEKNNELEIEQGLRIQSLTKLEEEWRAKLAEKEEEIINLEAKLSESLEANHLKEMELATANSNAANEIEALSQEVQKLETDYLQLTNENSKLQQQLTDRPSECDLSKLKSQVCELEKELTNKEIVIQEISAFRLDLENKCADMEHELQSLKDKAFCHDNELCKVRGGEKEQEAKISDLQHKLEHYPESESEDEDYPPAVHERFEIPYSDAATEMYGLFYKLYEQLQHSIANMKNQKFNALLPSCTCTKYGNGPDNSKVSRNADLMTQKEDEVVLNTFTQLKYLFEGTVTLCAEGFCCSQKEVIARVKNAIEIRNKLGNYNLECEATELNEKLFGNFLEPNKLETCNTTRKRKVKDLRHGQRKLESQSVHKSKLDINMDYLPKERRIFSSDFDKQQNDILVLNGSMDSKVPANRTLVKETSEIDSKQCDLEPLSELQEENLLLSERISGLEAVLRYMNDEKESSRLALQNSESQAMSLQDEVKVLENEMESQIDVMKQKLQDVRKQLIDEQEEHEYLKIANQELQATTESLIKERNSLHKSNGELRKQNTDLKELCTVLEAELKGSHKVLSDTLKEVEALEAKFSLVIERISLNEKAINSELDAFLLESKNHKEKLAREESLLNQMYVETVVDVENLQRNVAQLTEQMSVTRDDKERTASEAVLEVYSLRADKAKLKTALEEVQGRVHLYESKLEILQMESEMRLVKYIGELAASKKNQEILTVDYEKVRQMLEDAKGNEEKLDNIIIRLEAKLKASKYERQKLAEEVGCLRVQSQTTERLKDEVFTLKRSLCAEKKEKQRLEASFQMLSGDYEELKSKRISYVQKISNMEKAMSELEDCKRSKAVLEEKIMQLEWDLVAGDALRSQVAELKNELGEIKRTNSKFLRSIRHLEGEKSESLRKVQALEEELRKKIEVKQEGNQRSKSASVPRYHASETIKEDETNDQAKQFWVGPNKLETYQHLKQIDNKQDRGAGNSPVIGTAPWSKNILENELAEDLVPNVRSYKNPTWEVD